MKGLAVPRKLFFLLTLFVAIFAAASPASAYLDLVLAPPGYIHQPDSPEPEITVQPSEQFILEWSIWTDYSGIDDITGIEAYVSFDPDLVKLKDQDGHIVDYPSNPVDDEYTDFNWNSIMPKNEGDNVTGKVNYEQQMTFGDSHPLSLGKTHIGYLQFHCEGFGDTLISPTAASRLLTPFLHHYEFDNLQATLVHQVPEPSTILLLGTGLLGLAGVVRRRKR